MNPPLAIAPRIVCAAVALLLVTAFSPAAIATAESAGENSTAGRAGGPFIVRQFTAKLDATRFQGRVDTPLSILLTLTPDPPPSGFFYTSVVDVLDRPPGKDVEIVPGAREIRVRCFEPGSYRLRIRVNLIEKSSCGGVGADILMEEEVLLDIAG